MTRLLIAPDKFKGSLTAAEVVAALARGLAATAPDAEILACPIADGGDGTVDAALATGADAHPATVTGPTGAPRETVWALEGTTAVLELADAVGLKALPDDDLAPRTASSRGLGELILEAVRAGARTIVVGLGGSASTDGGAGLLQALGARLLTADGTDLAPARETLGGAALIAANDVGNPLLGDDGAAAVYGPQKGLDAQAVASADRTLAAAAALLDPSGEAARAEGAGAAGGVGFALLLLGATQRSGADVVLELADFDERLQSADLVVTGEGKLDAQTLQGKGPAEVARRGAAAGLPVLAVAGAVTLEARELADAGIDEAFDLVSRAADVPEAISRGAELLEEMGREIGRSLPALLGDSPDRRIPLP
jgi:glycerate kinase